MPKTPPPPAPKKSNRSKTPVKPAPLKKFTYTPITISGHDVRLMKRDGPRHPLVPARDPHYCFREDLLREIAWSLWPHDGGQPMAVALVGQKGSGKTSLIEQVAAHCNIPVWRINLNSGTTVRYLKGRTGAKDGSTHEILGPVPLAMEAGGILLLDEVSGGTPPVNLSLFPVLEPTGAVFLEEGDPPRYVRRHPDFRICVTDNTIGADQAETRFLYQGTNLMNAALLDRVDTTLQVPYLDPEAERRTVEARVGMPKDKKLRQIMQLNIEGMVRVAGHARETPDIGGGFSHRMLVSWARRVCAGRMAASGRVTRQGRVSEIVSAAHPAFLTKMPSPEDREAILEIIQRVFGASE